MVSIFIAGGIVMWPLLLFSLLAIALVLERLWFWSQINQQQRRTMNDILRTYRQSPMDVFDKLRKSAGLPAARVFLEALSVEGANPKQFHLALASAMQAEIPHLRRFNTVFATIVTVAPLLGLLGTVLGLIETFSSLSIGDVGGSDTTEVTGGISEALIATASGMVVAISTLLFANLFRSLYKRQISLLQEYAGQLEVLHEGHYERRVFQQESPYVPSR